jgi:hypothetical protein
MPKICEMDGVREYAEGLPVELWTDNGRLLICPRLGFDGAAIDLLDLLAWLQHGNRLEALSGGRSAISIELSHP